ncbi:beta-L-arabinofuranosidase domain-containing protein [Haloferula sp. BvORR071]|uniref:beta-L-arabinofuranosidase domain-containing protein n=1 Tax=Haloferula sp. BvORR071 TaxID=1396141 RepID=UPI00069905F1|nr:beta-L-arabinofuranosidase domain-containing protein [Haloferula sp. BvORR071]
MTFSRFWLLALHLPLALEAAPIAKEAVSSRAPLKDTPFLTLDLGSVEAQGWLTNQLHLQADGLTGHAEQVIPELGPDNGWRGGKGESWEKGPYFIRGLVSLAYVTKDPKLKAQAQKWIDAIIASQRPDGQIGPASNKDWWPRMVILWTLRDYYEATKDPRVIPLMTKYCQYMLMSLPQQPLQEWAKARAGDQIDTVQWLYKRTGDAFLLELATLLEKQANRWNGFYRSLRGSAGDFRIEHGVNVSQGMKFPVANYERTGNRDDALVFQDAWTSLRRSHGLSIGMWSGSEPLAGKSTTQGIEMCSIVEQMLSNEVAMEVLGDPLIADRHERIAFNLLPGGTTKEFKQFQYYTLPNAPVAQRNFKGTMPFADDHGDDLLCSPHSGFHCCCYNLHMGWPKYVQHAWMATQDGGLAAVAYGPTKVSVTLGDTPVSILEETDYPFSDALRFTLHPGKPLEFPLKLRIPSWVVNPRVAVNGEFVDGVKAGEFLTLERTWKEGDQVVAEFPAELATENAYNGSASLWRGPLVFSLRIKEEVKPVTLFPGGFDEVELTPASPWNYALDLDRAKPQAKLSRSKMPNNPWLPETTPVKLTVAAKRLPDWGLVRDDHMAAEVPPSPVKSDQPLEEVTLVPFGAQTLRITAFPLLRGGPVLEPGFSYSYRNGGDAGEEILRNPAPASSRGEGIPRLTFWNHLGTREWLQWTFDKPEEASSTSVYWFDDSGSGRCRVPESWRLLYLDGTEWKPVDATGPFGTAVNRPNVVKFTPVKTRALKMELQLEEGVSGGVLQWTKQ